MQTANWQRNEFAILAPNVQMVESRRLIERLRNNLKAYNELGLHKFELSLSIGAAEIEHADEFHIQNQMARADEAMYRGKRGKRVLTGASINQD